MATGYRIGVYSYIGYAKETTWSTAINPVTSFIPFESEGLGMKKPPQQITTAINAMVTPTYSVPGRGNPGGTIGLPLFPDVGMHLPAGSVGPVASVAGSTPTNSTTLAASVSAGATTISTTATFAANDIIQIDSTASGIAECRKVVGTPTGAGPYTVTLDVALDRAHANAATVAKVVAPFTQAVLPGDLPSFTVEKFIPNDSTSRQYPGSMVSKYSVTADAKGHVKASADVLAYNETVLTGASVSAFVKPSTTPINFDQVKVSFGTVGADIGGVFVQNTDITTHDWSIDNAIKPDETQNNAQLPTRLYQTKKGITGKLTAYFADETQRTNYINGTGQAVQFSYLNGTGYGLIVSLPEVKIDTFTEPVKIGDLTRFDMGWYSEYNASLGTHIQMHIISANYLPY